MALQGLALSWPVSCPQEEKNRLSLLLLTIIINNDSIDNWQ